MDNQPVTLHVAVHFPKWLMLFTRAYARAAMFASILLPIDTQEHGDRLGRFIARHAKMTVENVAL
jgi:hypothetical protein